MTYLLHNIDTPPTFDPVVASNYNTVEQINNTQGLLTFDGIYKNVWFNAEAINMADREVILFVMGNYVGGDNSFDVGMPYEAYCDWNQIMDMVVNYGAKLGWHTWSHSDLTTLSEDEIRAEVTPPFPMDYFAYPYGRYNDTVKKIVEEVGYKNAWSVTQGNDDPYSLKRDYIHG